MSRLVRRVFGDEQLQYHTTYAACFSAAGGFAISVLGVAAWQLGFWVWVLGFAALITGLMLALTRAGNYHAMHKMALNVGYVREVSLVTNYTHGDAEFRDQRIRIAQRMDSDRGSHVYESRDRHFSVAQGDPVAVVCRDGMFLINVKRLSPLIVDGPDEDIAQSR